MIPDPLHPAVVHLPLALAVLLPLAAAVALVAIWRGVRPLHAWAVPAALALLLAGASWVALETGEDQEERVEAVVPEAAIHEHEEAAERFLLFGALLAAVAVVGLRADTVGTGARVVASLGTLVVLVAGVQVGRAGGDLVYVHGAADAYVADRAPGEGPGRLPTSGDDDDDDDDDRGRRSGVGG